MSMPVPQNPPEALEELLTRIRRDATLLTAKEEAVRQAVVLPLLRQLGWNTDNILEVCPELPVEGKEADYCLKIGSRDEVIIESKRGGESLGKEHHEEQLLNYAFRLGAPLAVLTNGIEWWFYVPLRPGPWRERKFFVIDISQQEASSVSDHFKQFLGREAVSNGGAVQNANRVLDNELRARKTAEALPSVWEEIWAQPDDMPNEFLDFIRKKVESKCGFQATDEEVVDFLSRIRFDTNAIKQEALKEHIVPKADRATKRERVGEILRDGKWHSSTELRKTLKVDAINSVLYALQADRLVELRHTSRGSNEVRLRATDRPI